MKGAPKAQKDWKNKRLRNASIEVEIRRQRGHNGDKSDRKTPKATERRHKDAKYVDKLTWSRKDEENAIRNK